MSPLPVYLDALDGADMVRVLRGGRLYLTTLADLAAFVARAHAPVARFTGTGRLPALAVGQQLNLTLSGLVPGVEGDRLRKGEVVLVAPATPLPNGVNIAAALVPADDAVTVQLTTQLALTGSAAIAWNVVALR